MGSKMITDITSTQTTMNDTDNFILQETSGGTTKKTLWSTIKSNLKTYFDGVYQAPVLGTTLKFERTYTAISASNPWFCLSLADVNWTTTNYSSEFITEMRSRKVIYDEMGASPVSSFGGSWSGDTFTLTDNAANVAMITALAREYLYAGSPISGWRLLHDGTNEFNIIAISVSARTIKVNLDSKTAAGSAIEIYRHRVYGSTTSARHFSEAGLGFYQAGGDKISGLRRLDQMQGWQLGSTADSSGARNYFSSILDRDKYNQSGPLSGYGAMVSNINDQGISRMLKAVSDGTNGTPRTGTKTEIESGTLLAYIYVGTYTE